MRRGSKQELSITNPKFLAVLVSLVILAVMSFFLWDRFALLGDKIDRIDSELHAVHLRIDVAAAFKTYTNKPKPHQGKKSHKL
jgi:hypothetical protein